MAYIEEIILNKVNQKFLDGFGNIRVTEPFTMFDSKLTTPGSELFWDDQELTSADVVVPNGVDTSSTWSQNRASRTLTVNSSVNKKRVRQTRIRPNYQPGKSNIWLMTAVLGNYPTGITKRIGQFDSDNGYFYEFSENTVSVCIRSKVSGSVVDTKVAQSNWNTDKVNYNNDPTNSPCGYILDPTKALIYGCFYEWLGVGTVWFFVVINGSIIVTHQFHHSNIISSVYTSTPVLPLRCEIGNNGSASSNSLECICSSIISQGGQQRTGLSRGISRITPLIIQNTGVWYPVLSVRLNSTYKCIEIRPVKISIICTSNSNMAMGMFINPGVAGTDGASWQNLPSSSLQYDFSRGTTNTLVNTLGTCLFTQFSISQSEAVNTFNDAYWTIGTDLSNKPDELVLGVISLTTNNETFYGSVSFVEAL